MMKKLKKPDDEKVEKVLDLIADAIVSRVVSVMDELGYEVNRESAEKILISVGVRLAEKNKDIAFIQPSNN